MNDDNNKMIGKPIKEDFNKVGSSILLYMIIINIIVFIGIIFVSIIASITNQNMPSDITNDGNYYGVISIFADIIAFSVFLKYRGKEVFLNDLNTEKKKFDLRIVILAAIILLSLNNILGGVTDVFEIGLNTIGLSADNALKKLEILDNPAIPMMITVCIEGPIFEEFIFRGVILKSLEKYGKCFAIIVSALLFGLMHGNFYQTIGTIGIGIVLGYLATEYSIKLTILLHILNNAWAEITSMTFSHLSDNTQNMINMIILIVSAIILLIAFIKKRSDIRAWIQNNRIEKGIMLKFFTSGWIVLVVIIDLISVISGIGKI